MKMSAQIMALPLMLLLFAATTAQVMAQPAPRPLVYADQGASWDSNARIAFYCQDQGSRMMPLAWLLALERTGGTPFMQDDLTNYGYLEKNLCGDGLPLGFTKSMDRTTQWVGLTCAACHTREIVATDEQSPIKKTYRIDGGPALSDFQALLADVDASFTSMLADTASFERFAGRVLGPHTPTPIQISALRSNVEYWYCRYHEIIVRGLPDKAPWGAGRLDAIGMIFDRVAGLDIKGGKVTKENITRANAPTRYPFLWNAPYQKRTQWTGFAANGNDVTALARNAGEVLGVFGQFQPKARPRHPHQPAVPNSINFHGIKALEDSIRQIGPPVWPWSTDPALVAYGAVLFATRTSGLATCMDCHGARATLAETPTAQRNGRPLLDTPLKNVCSDTLASTNLLRKSKSEQLTGAFIKFFSPTKPLLTSDATINILTFSVGATILDDAGLYAFTGIRSPYNALKNTFTLSGPSGPFFASDQDCLPKKAVYEARVLEGVWAAAPYLHNGSIATLRELLTAPALRSTAFAVGTAYDTVNVGMSVHQAPGSAIRKLTDCTQRESGDSNCGHTFGTDFSEYEKSALIEYLKTL